jgi:hypothetical protein
MDLNTVSEGPFIDRCTKRKRKFIQLSSFTPPRYSRLRFRVDEDFYMNYVQNRHQSWRHAHSQKNHTISQPVLAIYPKEVRSIFIPLSCLLISEKDPVADWLVAATVLKSADYLPDLTTEVGTLRWRFATVTTNDSARFFQAPTGFTLNTRRSLMRLYGNGLTERSNT